MKGYQGFTKIPDIDGIEIVGRIILGFLLGNYPSKMQWTKKYLQKRYGLKRYRLDAALASLQEKGYISATSKKNVGMTFTIEEKGKEIYDILYPSHTDIQKGGYSPKAKATPSQDDEIEEIRKQREAEDKELLRLIQ